ncbi:17888_t:CDS:2, partial [Funneliformis caledonium]
FTELPSEVLSNCGVNAVEERKYERNFNFRDFDFEEFSTIITIRMTEENKRLSQGYDRYAAVPLVMEKTIECVH